MVDTKYCRDPDRVRLMPGAAEGLRILVENGFSIVVVTNQSGIGRGYFDRQALEAVNSRLSQELQARGATLHALYYCPHLPDDVCSCRKPMPGLLLRAAADLDLDLATCYMVGDRGLDVEAGRAAGARTILISKDHGGSGSFVEPDFVAKDLVEAARLILSDQPLREEVPPCES